MIQKRLLPEHLTNICTKRVISCLICEKSMSFDLLNGHSQLCNSSYQGEMKKGLKHGIGTFKYADGSKYTGKYGLSLFWFSSFFFSFLLHFVSLCFIPVLVCDLSS